MTSETRFLNDAKPRSDNGDYVRLIESALITASFRSFFLRFLSGKWRALLELERFAVGVHKSYRPEEVVRRCSFPLLVMCRPVTGQPAIRGPLNHHLRTDSAFPGR
jgi:hypothetical protein